MLNKVNNLAEYAKTKKYVLANLCEGELWFFSAWDDEERAFEQFKEMAQYETMRLVMIINENA